MCKNRVAVYRWHNANLYAAFSVKIYEGTCFFDLVVVIFWLTIGSLVAI